jgi:hypothetical protein
MLPARNKSFVVRDIIDEQVMELLPFDKSGSIAICGLGGCGYGYTLARDINRLLT